MGRVCRDPSLIPGAVSEAMRFEPSVASFVRVTTEDIEVGDAVLPARQFIILSTMSGARDEEAYERPDVFDIRRTDQAPLFPAFGAGAHRCIGEALARVELEESLAALAARTSNWIKRLRSRGTAESAASIPCGYPGGPEPQAKLR
jgi:cytochrome P450